MKTSLLAAICGTLTLVLAFHVFKVQGQSCSDEWFGNSCQFKCHCKESVTNSIKCNDDGSCPSGYKCERGWFGPACQYVDLAAGAITQPDIVSLELTDGDDNTCLETQSDQSVTLDLKTKFLFTWLRLYVSKSSKLNEISLQLGNSTNVYSNCLNQRNNTISDNTIDIFCDIKFPVQYVYLIGEGVDSLCSVYVSGGRNVALKQTTNQSTTWSEGYINYSRASNAVDGNTDGEWNNRSCTHTLYGSLIQPTWTVQFHRNMNVNRYIIYNRVIMNPEVERRLQGFTIQSFNGSQEVYSYRDREPDSKRKYIVQPDSTQYSVSKVEISIVSGFQKVLTLCEVEIFGDCSTGTFDLKCDKNCSKNCKDDGRCYPSNGQCVYGCKNGYTGTLCDVNCETMDASGCPSKCSQNCGGNGSCNQTNRHCDHGCKPGYKEQLCNETCSFGRFGINCLGNCSSHCGGDKRCNHEDGTCYDQNCAPGYKGSLCNETCSFGRFGINCLGNCSSHCGGDKRCNHEDGTCYDQNCAPGYKGSLCNETCPSGKFGTKCAGNCSYHCGGDKSCDHEDGTCNDKNCDPGYKGSLCNELCLFGTFGHMCAESCSSHCGGDKSCFHLDGTCNDKNCAPGYKGFLCNERCENGRYGSGCSLICSKNCMVNETLEPSTCNHTDGLCLLGCVDGQRGPAVCISESTGSDSPPIPVIVGAAVGFFVLVLLVVVGVLLWRRRRKPKSEDQTSHITQPSTEESVISVPGPNRISTVTRPPIAPKPKLSSSPSAESNTKPKGPYYNTVSEFSPTAIAVSKLDEFMSSHDKAFFEAQFYSIPPNSEASMTDGLSDENKYKNRYKNIIAYNHSRVHLEVNVDKQQGDYINACYVQGYKDDEKFIASQGPNAIILHDFVRMLWEKKVDKVVMLTNLTEEGRNKCDRYWPEDDEELFGDVKVKLTTTEIFADYTIRRLQLSKDGSSTHEVTHFHFTSWPDKDVPTTPWGLVDFEQRVASLPTSKPIVVHCSAGVGRTGTFIALRNIMREAEETGYMDFYSTLKKLRQDRVYMIQTLEQYVFLHKAAQVAVVCIGTTITSSNITERMKILNMKSKSGKTKLETEFEEICNLCADKKDILGEEITEEITPDGTVYQNSGTAYSKLKNRYCDILPKESYRPFLSSGSEGMGNYINAVLVQSFTKQRENILTQLPLPNTVNDFWLLVTQYQVSLIVAFEVDAKATDETVAEYLPASEDEPFSNSHFDVKTGSVKNSSLWLEQKLFVSKQSKSDEVQNVIHLRCNSADLDPCKLLTFVDHARSSKPPGKGRTLFMCRNGAKYSGLTCVLSLLLDRIDNDHRLTVPLVVGTVKAVRPQVISTSQEYEVLYKVLQLYQEASNEYFNFGESETKPTTGTTDKEETKVYANS